eukprot:3934717-Rhodomonas_salina.1
MPKAPTSLQSSLSAVMTTLTRAKKSLSTGKKGLTDGIEVLAVALSKGQASLEVIQQSSHSKKLERQKDTIRIRCNQLKREKFEKENVLLRLQLDATEAEINLRDVKAQLRLVGESGFWEGKNNCPVCNRHATAKKCASRW